MTSSGDWGLARRISFRFWVLFAGLLIYPFPLWVIPESDVVSQWLTKPFELAAIWLGDHLLGIPGLVGGPNGSGDRTFDYVQLLLLALLAVAGALVWSILDRRRTAYPRLAAAANVVLRYALAAFLISYGVSKVFKLQFPDLSPGILRQRVGDSSPMRLVWTFMGYSTPYTMFAGAAEVVAGVLLLWRRTVVLGALLALVVMFNVVLLNLCYDVPVKLFSAQLVVFAVAILLPDARRLLGVALGRGAPEVAPRPRMSVRRERIRCVAKYGFLACVAVSEWLQTRGELGYNDHGHELYGDWTVDRFVSDGVEHPPLTTDPERWQAWTAGARAAGIWRMDGKVVGQLTNTRGYDRIIVDPDKHTITVTIASSKPADANSGQAPATEVWTYARPAPDRLVIDGPHGGHRLHVELHLEPERLLMTRGFHWINEQPLNR